jgi:hypothetical protein
MSHRLSFALAALLAAVPVAGSPVDRVNTAAERRTPDSIRARVLSEVPLGTDPFSADDWLEKRGFDIDWRGLILQPGGSTYQQIVGTVPPGDGGFTLPRGRVEIWFQFKDGRLADVQVRQVP